MRKLPNTENAPLWARSWCSVAEGGVMGATNTKNTIFMWAEAGGMCRVGEEDAMGAHFGCSA